MYENQTNSGYRDIIIQDSIRLPEARDIQPFQLSLTKAETLLSDYYADPASIHLTPTAASLSIKERRTRIS